MAKNQTTFVCNSCQAQSLQWAGRCTQCGAWDSLEEKKPLTKASRNQTWVPTQKPVVLSQVALSQAGDRWPTQVEEFDRVTGGGFVKGSFGLLGGAPGVGKSTLILQLLSKLSRLGRKVLYVSGEESAPQIRQRAERLGLETGDLLVLVESRLEEVLAVLASEEPDFVVIDSIQTLQCEQVPSGPGSVSQVRESASLLIQYAKRVETAVLLIGHITKGGDLAGPKTLEHMVDYVLYLEGEGQEQLRILRAVKNRFGDVAEVGLFKMTPSGLAQVKNPQRLFQEDAAHSRHPGTCIYPASEGSRTLFLEIQVLVGDTEQSYPARTVAGLDKNRLNLMVAVLEKHLRMDFSRNDIYANLAGGFKVQEPALDLALLAAILSSHRLKPLPGEAVFLGEVALTGEIRRVPCLEERLKEAARCGFRLAYLPAVSAKNLKADLGMTLVPVPDVAALADLLA